MRHTNNGWCCTFIPGKLTLGMDGWVRVEPNFFYLLGCVCAVRGGRDGRNVKINRAWRGEGAERIRSPFQYLVHLLKRHRILLYCSVSSLPRKSVTRRHFGSMFFFVVQINLGVTSPTVGLCGWLGPGESHPTKVERSERFLSLFSVIYPANRRTEPSTGLFGSRVNEEFILVCRCFFGRVCKL